jgi:sporulation protein YlmC with PRC-barrel domain
MEERFDLVYKLLDDQIVDVDGRRCGRVDDIELVVAERGALRLHALRSGRGAYPDRLPPRLRRLARIVFGREVLGRTVRQVPWSAVDHVDVTVHLLVKARELGLAQGDRDLAPHAESLEGG